MTKKCVQANSNNHVWAKKRNAFLLRSDYCPCWLVLYLFYFLEEKPISYMKTIHGSEPWAIVCIDIQVNEDNKELKVTLTFEFRVKHVSMKFFESLK